MGLPYPVAEFAKECVVYTCHFSALNSSQVYQVFVRLDLVVAKLAERSFISSFLPSIGSWLELLPKHFALNVVSKVNHHWVKGTGQRLGNASCFYWLQQFRPHFFEFCPIIPKVNFAVIHFFELLKCKGYSFLPVKLLNLLATYHHSILVVKNCKLVYIQSTWSVSVEVLKQVDKLHVLLDLVAAKNIWRLNVFLKPLQEFFGIKTVQLLGWNIPPAS